MTRAVLTPNHLRPFTFVSLISKRSRLYHSVLNDIPSNRLWTPLATRLSNRVHGATESGENSVAAIYMPES